MSDDQSTDHARPLPPWPILVGLAGAVLLTGGVALALYSQFVATPIPVPFDSYPETSTFPSRLAYGAVIFAAVFTVIGAVVLVRGRRNGEQSTTGGALTLAGVLIVGIGFAVTSHIPSTYQHLTTEFVATPRVPAAVAALALVLLGSALMLVGGVLRHITAHTSEGVGRPTDGHGVEIAGPRPGRPHHQVEVDADRPAADAESTTLPRWPAMVMAVLVGAVPVLAAAGLAVALGDDSGAVDHVTAARGSDSAVPTTLGPEKFRLQLPATTYQDTRVLPAGAGFLVSTSTGVTLHDGATGAERWHYRRIGSAVTNVPAETFSLRGEDVVLTYWGKRGWMAFDAFTGELLWTESDFSRARNFTVRGHVLATASSRGEVARYDARTGGIMWTTPREVTGCASSNKRVVATASAIYRTAVCGEADAQTVVVTAYDPRSGAVRDQRGFPTPHLRSEVPVDVHVLDSGFVWIKAWHDRDVTEIFLPPNRPLTSAVADSGRTNSAVPAADDDALVSSDGPGGRAIPGRWEILPADGGAAPTRLDMTTPDGLGRSVHAAALLADQVVAATSPDSYTLRTWDRSTGHPEASRPVTVASNTGILRWATVPGALLLIATDHDRNDVEIIGFG
ncbi:PQQ-binding-like beta-propeller repeat protein [Nocardia asteroides]|uniref:outer membrane protein assembly factor BamB family protein n=1 Tax=Nocardia asteroides TaxID=1824 RepID=UPI0037940842